jgi:hypothetical protein
VNLDRGEYRIYTTEYIERPEWLNTSIDETGIFHSENIRVYPNPASDVVNFTLDLNEQSEVAIHIFDVMGKLVTTLEKGHMQAGLQNVSWNLLNDMNSGIYFALIRTGNKMETVKFTIE